MASVTIDGATIHYELSGTGADWLVLLHEIGGTLESWSAIVPGLERRFRVLRYDQRGAGSSSAIEGAFSLDTQVNDVGRLLAALGQNGPFHIAGVAIGAALAIAYAAQHAAAVKSLVMACPAPGVSAERIQYLSERATQVEREGMTATVDNTLGNSYPPEVVRDRTVYDRYRQRFLANDPANYAAINRAFAAFDATQHLASLACPVLVLAGRHDRLRPPDFVAAVAGKIQGSRYHLIDSGHIMPVQAPAEMLAAMEEFYDSIA